MSMSNNEIIEIVRKTIEVNGPLSINDIGVCLMKSHGKDLMDAIKKNFKGLKGLLTKNSNIFKNIGKPPQFLFTLVDNESMKKKNKKRKSNHMNLHEEQDNEKGSKLFKSADDDIVISGYLSDIDHFMKKRLSKQFANCFNLFSSIGDHLRSKIDKVCIILYSYIILKLFNLYYI